MTSRRPSADTLFKTCVNKRYVPNACDDKSFPEVSPSLPGQLGSELWDVRRVTDGDNGQYSIPPYTGQWPARDWMPHLPQGSPRTSLGPRGDKPRLAA
ncbi:hypothetical protein ACOMHN_043697 [Nucella lapillus]